jgi:hypothetical protein
MKATIKKLVTMRSGRVWLVYAYGVSSSPSPYGRGTWLTWIDRDNNVMLELNREEVESIGPVTEEAAKAIGIELPNVEKYELLGVALQVR